MEEVPKQEDLEDNRPTKIQRIIRKLKLEGLAFIEAYNRPETLFRKPKRPEEDLGSEG